MLATMGSKQNGPPKKRGGKASSAVEHERWLLLPLTLTRGLVWKHQGREDGGNNMWPSNQSTRARK